MRRLSRSVACAQIPALSQLVVFNSLPASGTVRCVTNATPLDHVANTPLVLIRFQ